MEIQFNNSFLDFEKFYLSERKVKLFTFFFIKRYLLYIRQKQKSVRGYSLKRVT